MSSLYNLKTKKGLGHYLGATRSQSADLKFLSGGTANYVYRSTKKDGSTSIFKHAAPFLHSNKSFAFDPARMDYEAKILTQLGSESEPFFQHSPGPNVRAVRVFSYDKENKLLEIEDGGNHNLKDAYTNSELDIPRTGQDLAKWLAALHDSSKEVSLALSDEESSTRNNPIGVAIYRYSYKHLDSALKQFGYDVDIAHRINEEFGSLLATDDECVCQGDFWPGNVLVRTQENQPTKLTIVDWEMVRRGTSATDVAQFAAEAFLLDRFRGGKGLRVAFLHSYLNIRKDAGVLGKAWLRRMVVHWAVHVAFWPTGVEWADEAGTKELVDIGVATLESILQDDWDKVLVSPLLQDVKDVCALFLQQP